MLALAEQPKNSSLKIGIIGVGGCGIHTVNVMIAEGMEGVDFIVVDMDPEPLERSFPPTKFRIGSEDWNPKSIFNTPRKAALQDREQLLGLISEYNVIVIVAGMGGKTGSEVAPVIAQLAQEIGVLAIAVVSRPFGFEKRSRGRNAAEGIAELSVCSDGLIVIKNQFITSKDASLKEVFIYAEGLLYQNVKGVIGLLNISCEAGMEFEELRDAVRENGLGLIGIGQAAGKKALAIASHAAMTSSITDNGSFFLAKSLFVRIITSSNVGLGEILEEIKSIQYVAPDEANVSFDWVVDENMGKGVLVIIFGTSLEW